MARCGPGGPASVASVVIVTFALLAAYVANSNRQKTSSNSLPPARRPIEVLPPLSAKNDEVNQLLVLCRKIALPVRPSVVEALHYWRLCLVKEAIAISTSTGRIQSGQTAEEIASDDIKRSLLVESEYIKRFGASDGAERLITPAEGGLTISNKDKKRRSDGQSHPGQFLFYLSECNVSLDDEVQLTEGTFRVSDILRRELLFFDQNESAAKTAPAFARYLAPQQSFRTWNQTEISFTGMMSSLIKDSPESGWCHGTHRLYAVATLLKISESEKILPPPVRAEALHFLTGAIDHLSLSQHPDGAWRYDWIAQEPAAAQPFAEALWGDSIVVTGHHLEWLFLMDDSLVSPLDTSIERARRFLHLQLTALTPADVAKDLIAWSHAARSLLIWETRLPLHYSK